MFPAEILQNLLVICNLLQLCEGRITLLPSLDSHLSSCSLEQATGICEDTHAVLVCHSQDTFSILYFFFVLEWSKNTSGVRKYSDSSKVISYITYQPFGQAHSLYVHGCKSIHFGVEFFLINVSFVFFLSHPCLKVLFSHFMLVWLRCCHTHQTTAEQHSWAFSMCPNSALLRSLEELWYMCGCNNAAPLCSFFSDTVPQLQHLHLCNKA